MKHEHPPVVTMVIAFLITLLAIASGPIGLVVIATAGVPLALFFLLEMASHSSHTHHV